MQIDRILGNVGVLYVGAYNSSIQYEYLNCVTYNGSSYVCVNQNGVTGVEPGTTDDWQLSAKKGDVGPVGPKPVNGVDYNTDEEKEEFKNDVVSKATEEVEKNLADIETEAIENYNKNATQKITEYNTNANTQVESFNANATSKTNDFNSNARTKTEEFNTAVDAEKEQFAGQTEAINHHIAVVSDELERVKNDVLETGEESGSYITLNDSAMAEYQELSVDGVLEQKTTSGKNKLHIKEPQTYTQNGISYTINQDLSITLNGTATAFSKFNFINNSTLDNTKNYKVVIENFKYEAEILFGTDMGDKYNYGNLESGTSIISFANLQVSEGTTVNNLTYKIQVIEVDQSSDYESFTGGQPSPNPDYPQKIKTIENSINVISSTRNLLVLEDVENKVFSGTLKYTIKDGLVSCNGTPSGPWDFKNIKTLDDIFIDGETYTLWCNQMNYDRENDTPTLFFGLFVKRKDTGELMEIQKGIGFGNRRYIQTKVDYSKYSTYMLMLRTSANYTDNYSNSGLGLMITKGNEIPTKFEQCLQSQITANLPQGEFVGKIDDTYKDTLKVEYNEEDGEYHLNLYKMLKKYTFTGNEIFSLSSTNSNYIEFFANSTIRDAANSLPTLSNYFLYNINNRIAINNTGIYIRVPILCGIDTLEKFNTFLSSNNVEVYYVLAKPYTIDLGVVDQLISYDKVSNVFTNSDLLPQINLKYYRNFESTVRNLQINNGTLQNELSDLQRRVSALETAQTSIQTIEENV